MRFGTGCDAVTHEVIWYFTPQRNWLRWPNLFHSHCYDEDPYGDPGTFGEIGSRYPWRSGAIPPWVVPSPTPCGTPEQWQYGFELSEWIPGPCPHCAPALIGCACAQGFGAFAPPAEIGQGCACALGGWQGEGLGCACALGAVVAPPGPVVVDALLVEYEQLTATVSTGPLIVATLSEYDSLVATIPTSATVDALLAEEDLLGATVKPAPTVDVNLSEHDQLSATVSTPPAIRVAAWITSFSTSDLFTIGRPDTVQAGDVLLAFLANDAGENWTAIPSGWMEALNVADSGHDVQLSVYWKVATASEPAGYTWGGSTANNAGVLADVTGTVATSLDGHTTNAALLGSTLTALGLTPTKSYDLLFGAFAGNDGTLSLGAGLNLGAQAAAGTDLKILVGYQNLTGASPTGNYVATQGTAAAWCAAQVLVPPS
jgi:hypothetical protein